MSLPLFLPEPLAEPSIRALLGVGSATPARLGDHALRVEGARLVLARAPGQVAEGALVQATETAAFALAALGGGPADVEATTDGPVPALAFLGGRVPEDSPRWTANGWTDLQRATLREMLAEILAHRGQRAPEAVARLLPGIGFRAEARVRGAAMRAPQALRTARPAADLDAASMTLGYVSHFAVEDHVLRHRRFDGAMSPNIERAVFASGDAVTLLPFDPRTGSVLLVEQFRPGPFARRDPNPWCLEPVAGRCDGLEPPEATARREAREEAGIAVGRVVRIASYYTSPGTAAEYITAFVGEADLAKAGGVHGLVDEHEDIRVEVVPLETAFAAIASGEVNNAQLILSLFWLERNHHRLAAEWAGPEAHPAARA